MHRLAIQCLNLRSVLEVIRSFIFANSDHLDSIFGQILVYEVHVCDLLRRTVAWEIPVNGTTHQSCYDPVFKLRVSLRGEEKVVKRIFGWIGVISRFLRLVFVFSVCRFIITDRFFFLLFLGVFICVRFFFLSSFILCSLWFASSSLQEFLKSLGYAWASFFLIIFLFT